MALVYFEITNFKSIGESRGRSNQDSLVTEFARILRGYCRGSNDWTARSEDNVFILVLNGSPERDTYKVCKRIADRIDRAGFVVDGKRFAPKVRVG